jgi:hypothetical protein
MQHGYSVWYLCHHAHHRVPQILYRLEESALVNAADSVLGAGIAPKKPVSFGMEPGTETVQDTEASLLCPS